MRTTAGLASLTLVALMAGCAYTARVMHVGATPDCTQLRTHHLGLELAASYLFGPGRASIAFGPVYELNATESGACD
jgi:hypothetical protein